MKKLSRIVLVSYLFVLLWLVLFKFSLHPPAVFEYARSLNVIPFAEYSRENPREMIYNLLVFIPFGLFLSINLKQASFWQKLALIFIFSLGAELVQLVFAIGAGDITDIIMNTSGGLLGLALYELSKKHASREKLDQFIVVSGAALLILSVSLIGILFSVGGRFQSPPPRERPQRSLDSESSIP